MRPITVAEVEQLAELAQLGLDAGEKERLAQALNAALALVAGLERVETEGVPPTVYGLDVENVWAEDAVRPSMALEDALANAPHVQGGYFRVPRIID